MFELGTAIKSAIGASVSVFKALSPKARRLKEERAAGRAPEGVSTDLLDQYFEETLARLRSQDANEEILATAFQYIGGKLVRPDGLNSPSVRNWLAETDVSSNLKKIASQRWADDEVDPESNELAQLLESCAHVLEGQDTSADEVINTVVAILIAGVRAALSPEGVVVVETVKGGFEKANKKIEELSDQIAQSSLTRNADDQIHTDAAVAALYDIKQMRIAPFFDAQLEISKLVTRIEEGNLAGTKEIEKAEIYYWAARICVIDHNKSRNVVRFLEEVKKLNPSRDVQIPEAWLQFHSGDFQGAINSFKSTDSPDTNTSSLSMIRTEKGLEPALDWARNADLGPNSLTPFGWSMIIQWAAFSGHWGDACRYVNLLSEHDYNECFGLALTAGAVLASQVFPDEFKPLVIQLQMVGHERHLLEGTEIDAAREKALATVGLFLEQSTAIDENPQIDAGRQLYSWLRLIDEETHEDEKRNIQERMKTGNGLVQYFELAEAFDIEFDEVQLRKHLKARRLSRGLDDLERGVEVLLNKRRLSPKDFIKYLEDNRSELEVSLPQKSFESLLIDTLMADNQIARAERLYEEMKADLDPESAARVDLAIRSKKGGDLSNSLREQFGRTGAQIDLENLINAIGNTEDWKGLLPLQQQLFDNFEANAKNAIRVCNCLRKLGRSKEIVEFLQASSGLVDKNSDLSSELAWAHFQRGNLGEARTINDAILTMRNVYQDTRLSLFINLFSGEWEEFDSVVRSANARFQNLEPHELLELASFAADTDRSLATSLIDQAVASGTDDPRLLLGAYTLLVSLGEDDRAWPLFNKAARVSTDDSIISSVSLEEMTELVPAHAEHMSDVSKKLYRAEIPIHLFAASSNIRLGQILISNPESNFTTLDSRMKIPIPIRSGQFKQTPTDRVDKVALDITSVLTLAQLGILEKVIEGFEKIYLPISTMPFLFEEIRRTRFHQPSLITSAKDEQTFCETAGVGTLRSDTGAKSYNSHSLPADMNEMLVDAKRTNGKVIVSLPVHAANSYLKETVDFGENSERILSVNQLCTLMHNGAQLDQRLYESAQAYLDERSTGESPGPCALPSGPIYIDTMALDNMQHAGLLNALARLPNAIILHKDTRERIEGLANLEAVNSKLEQRLNDVRRAIQAGLASDRISLLPMSDWMKNPEDDQSPLSNTPTLANLLEDFGDASLVALDDRCLDLNQTITDRSGKSAPVVSSIDFLNLLESKGVLDKIELFDCRHKARQFGYAIVSVEPEELARNLSQASIDQSTGKLLETNELKTIRDYFDLILASDIQLKVSELTYLKHLSITFAQRTRTVWLNLNVNEDVAIAESSWLLETILPALTDWEEKFMWEKQDGARDYSEILESHLVLLLGASLNLKSDRRQSFNKWMESFALPLIGTESLTFKRVIDRLQAVCLENLEPLVSDDITREAVAIDFLNRLPIPVSKSIKGVETFISAAKIRQIRVINFTENFGFEPDELLLKIRQAATENEPVEVAMYNSGMATVAVLVDRVVLRLADGSDHQLSLNKREFSLALPDVDDRITALEEIVSEIGCTGPNFRRWEELVTDRPINGQEYNRLMKDISFSTAAMNDRLRTSIEKNEILQTDLVPNDLEYYVRLVGPVPCESDFSGYINLQLETHRQDQVNQDPSGAMLLFAATNIQKELSPVTFFEGIDRERRQTFLREIGDGPSPFTILTALEVLIADDQPDTDVASEINSLVDRLCQDKLDLNGDADVYVVFSKLIELVFSIISEQKWASKASIYWRILCAVAQANQVLVVLKEFEVDEAECLKFLNQFTLPIHKVNSVCEMRFNKNWLIHNMYGPTLQASTLQRLSEILESGSVNIHDSTKAMLDDAIARLKQAGGGIFMAVPDFFEDEHSLSRRPTISHTDDEIAEMSTQLEESLVNQQWGWEAVCLQLYNYSPKAIATIRSALKTVNVQCQEEDIKKAVQNLNLLAIVAARTNDSELADSVAKRCVDIAGDIGEASVSAEVIIVLAAAASAIEDEDEWAMWLEKWCLIYISRLGRGELCQWCAIAIGMLRSHLDIHPGHLARAEALARLGS